MLIFLLLLQVSTDPRTAIAKPESKFRLVNKLSAASLPPSVFGTDWTQSAGLVVDDFQDLSKMPAVSRKIAEELKPQFKAIGVSGAADYSLVRRKAPLDTITVKVFVFTDVQKCKDWWKKKYESQEQQKNYKVVKDNRFEAVLDTVNIEYPSTNKRILKSGNVVITAHHLQKGDEHLKAFEHIIKQLATSKK
jgi:hypothetical protein